MSVKIGMVGLGRFALLHARVWKQIQDAEVVALCDRNPDTFPAFLELFPAARCYTDWNEMIADGGLDAVDVLTPETLHADPVLAALSEGLDVFVEKPLASDPWEAESLVQAAERHGRLLMAGHILRFDARYAAAKARIAQGFAGPIRSIYAKRNNGKRFFSAYSRISPVFILGIHDIDLMRWLLEDEVREVYAVRSVSEGRMENMIWAMLAFSRGTVGILENNWLLPDGADSYMDVRMEITGDDGSLVIRDPEQGMTVIGGAFAESPSFLNGYEAHGAVNGPLAQELGHFIDCLKSGRASDILRPQDALQAVRIAWAVRQSALRGERIRMTDLDGMKEGGEK